MWLTPGRWRETGPSIIRKPQSLIKTAHFWNTKHTAVREFVGYNLGKVKSPRGGTSRRTGVPVRAVGRRLARERVLRAAAALECTKCATCTGEKLHRPPCSRPLHCPTSTLQFGAVRERSGRLASLSPLATRRIPPLPRAPPPPHRRCIHCLKTLSIDIPLISYFARNSRFH